MSLYVLDTDTASLYERGHPLVVSRVDQQAPSDLAITVITVEEQLTGWYTLLRQARRPPDQAYAYGRLAVAVRLLARWPILTLSVFGIAQFDQLRAMGLNVGNQDLRIAAITLEHGGTIVTRNVRDFQRVPGLRVENWAA